jgi:hypothetical protein
LLLAHDPRPCSLASPDPGLGAVLADPHFILEPDRDLLKRKITGQNGLDVLDEYFLNAACLSGSTCEMTERAKTQPMSNRFSNSYTRLSV